jgi:two-component system OmpR family response regulator
MPRQPVKCSTDRVERRRRGKAQLRTSEANLLKVFVNNPNRMLQREQLLGTRDLASADRSIDVSISRLRRKLEPDAGSPPFIKTVYGAGDLFLATVTWPTGII